MCGIIGCLGNSKCYKHIIEGLKQLQNRGYDSAGLCTTDGHTHQLYKVASRENSDSISCLEERTQDVGHCLGIGHTRWATHGPKTDINAHPHLDTFNRFAIVHNGIIENYLELKEYILKVKNRENNGSTLFNFKSQTDTEVIANLISFEYLNHQGDGGPDGVKKAILRAINRLHGTYALAIINLNDPDRLYCIRNGSPLLVGVTDDMALVTSEKSGFNGEMVDYYVLDNNNLCILERKNGKIEFHTERTSY